VASFSKADFDLGVWPQVGAVLNFLDARIPQPDDLAGASIWDADGSAVLIAPNQALTIRHVAPGLTGRDGRVDMLGLAVFFPSVGLVSVESVWCTPGETHRDRLLVLKLADEVPLPPIPAYGVKTNDVQEPQAIGFGDWTAPPQAPNDPRREKFARGVARRLQPTLSRDPTDDLGWNVATEGEAGVNNSGGPILEKRPGGHQVAAIIRRVRDDILTAKGGKQILVSATKISENRAGWLFRTVYSRYLPQRFPSPEAPPPVLWRELDGPGVVGPISLPAGTAKIGATLSAARFWPGDLLLQMDLLPVAPSLVAGGRAEAFDPETTLLNLGQKTRSIGEFVARSRTVENEAAIRVAITPVSPLPGPVRMQLCLRFLDADGNMLPPVDSEGP
jgi:hypothetical protein